MRIVGGTSDLSFGYLAPGKKYKVCTDYDGTGLNMAFGYTGQNVLVSGFAGYLNATTMVN